MRRIGHRVFYQDSSRRAQPASLYCVTRSLDAIEVAGSADVEFDYQVNGLRKAFACRRSTEGGGAIRARRAQPCAPGD